ncbi:hypothetical protein AAIH22_31580, partial [Pseudomonas aeruginosa]
MHPMLMATIGFDLLDHFFHIPAIIYGGKEAPLAVELDHDKVMNMQVKAEFYSEVLTIVVDGKE